MKKAPEAFRTISEVSEILDTPAHVLRFWESKFYQIRPVKRAGGRRYYRPDDLALINGIRTLLQDRGLTIRGVQRVLQESGVRHVIELGANLPALADETLGEAADSLETAARGLEQAPADLPNAPPAPVPPRTIPTAPFAATVDAPQARAGLNQDESPARESLTPESTPAGSDEAGPLSPPAPEIRAEDQIRTHLRGLDPARLEPHRERLAGLLRRIDRLLDRMSEASGAGRW